MEATAKPVRVRIAPSPTGYLHIGNARTAIFNWLFARKHKGVFILRIEDTDKERSKPEYERDIIEGLRWLGLNWGRTMTDDSDNGENNDNEERAEDFYRQSERTEIYKKYLEKLLEEKKAYWCFCSREELEEEKQAMMAQGMAPKYSGKCRQISNEDSDTRRAQGEQAVIRFKMPETIVEFDDMIRGKVKFDLKLSGDTVIAKDLEAPLYNFTVVVDDYEMEITHVIRGEDHLANTPKQIALQSALGFSEVIYAHLPLILSSDRSKMSKRVGDSALLDYRKKGYLPEAIFNFLTLLGWHPEDEKEVLDIEETVQKFNIRRVQKAGAVLNQEKLDWFNAYYIRTIPAEKLIEYMKDFVPIEWLREKEIFLKALEVEKERMRRLSDFKEMAHFFFEISDYPKELLRWGTLDDEKILGNLKLSLDIFDNYDVLEAETRIMEIANKIGRGEILWPLRVAFSGLKASPGPFEIARVIGGPEAIKRLKTAIGKIS